MVEKARKPRKASSDGTYPSRRRSSFRPRRATRGGKKIVHTCGHEQCHRITGPQWKKDREIKRLEAQECTQCWATKRAEESEALCEQPNLPPLKGTPSQVAWARSLRGICLSQVKAGAWRVEREREKKNLPSVLDRYLSLAVPPLLKMTKAKWWIDGREGDLLDLALNSLAQAELEAIREETASAPEIIKPAAPLPEDYCPF